MGNTCNNHLRIPPAKGPNAVGCTDFMMDQTAQGSFFRLYYPCQETEKAETPDWVPCREYFNGLADFMKINRTLSERIFNYLFGSFKIPAHLDAPFKSNEKCPVVIFSHGLGAFRTLYSAICAELASQGFIVASVEHRDQSASATFYFREKTNKNVPKTSASAKDNLVKEWMYYRTLQHGESEFPLRNKQVKQRADECILTLDKLTEINSGIHVQNVLQTQFDWATLENSMDLCRIAAMGHSFGGATVIEALCKEVKFKCGIALDAWMFPLDDKTFPQVKQPIFFINSEKFQWAGNISRIRKLDSAIIQRKMITIRGTVHQSFPDFTFLTSNWIGKLMKLKGQLDPEIAIDLSNKATLAFLQCHLGLEKNFNQWDILIDGQDDNLIPGTNVTVFQSAI
ncbi:platelet-activating factor acetylhydrolase [Xiphias gladius]|uniref:platelet-activating factor acetylhydrolase n=1 Tax=Xiphias gladius TaxID=8245 RepID=UPI001A9814F1|nr:platelet-activating factor acetylhydrolase [Xiphias gladius]XP_039981623.1 platelet-activating factor acetylhydrolase [Xiphias gladius]XP_039981624.1 platelet-activating factor acetylhydrolase [Xiphias gladius]XP_039981625.1 platelet-activating factor acetylhydrolase [Xiphias gladius]XP_039981626.1 platelet-activating factor acetylhydrolase [Xiphias gladius]XP_039981627.1 platelet-activating factor acetylhydrolase [Xiphias gladius]XP_039981628.1 platelet-activating factor acetylhydrolase [